MYITQIMGIGSGSGAGWTVSIAVSKQIDYHSNNFSSLDIVYGFVGTIL